ncbi:MAG: DHH family phosphoesterase [Aquificaceae bacterium]
MLSFKGISKKTWVLGQNPVSRELELKFGPVAAKVLANRNVNAEYILEGFSLILRAGEVFKVEQAVEEIAKAVISKERIVIFADGDVDGITGCVLLYSVLKALGGRVSVVFSSRKRGYGLNLELLRKLEALGSVLITVDNGITSAKELSLTKMKTIVIDHHNPADSLPRAIVLSSKAYENEEVRGLSSAGMVFYLCRELIRRFNSELDLRSYLPLVALGTVADVMPLSAVNRRFVLAGIKILNKSLELNIQRVGIVEMIRFFGIEKVDMKELSYGIIPRLNAPGRLGRPDMSFRLLVSKDIFDIKNLLKKIENLNRYRKYLTRTALKSAISGLRDGNVLVAWIQKEMGPVGGIVASRLASIFAKPAVVLHEDGELLKGSFRAPGIDIFSLVKGLSVYLERFGGHKSAVGFSIKRQNLEAFLDSIDSILGTFPQQEFIIDDELDMKMVSKEVFNQIKPLEPFGEGFPEPVFVSKPYFDLKLYFENDFHRRYIRSKDIKVIYSLGKSPGSFIVKDVVYGSF